MLYSLLKKGLQDKGNLYPVDKIYDYVDDADKDFYSSLYYFNKEQYDLFNQRGSISGISDVITDRLLFDFDQASEIDKTKVEAQIAISRLLKYNINEDQIKIFFTGKKGFAVEVELTRYITPKEVRAICLDTIGVDLETIDRKIYNPSRSIRLPGTKHQDTGLYKIPLTLTELKNLTIDEIKTKATSLNNISDSFNWSKATPSPELFEIKKEEVIFEGEELITSLEFSKKPKWLSNCRWSLQNGFFKEGERNSALLCLGATYKNQGFSSEHVYRMLKGVATLSARITKTERYPDEEIYNNIVSQIYSIYWKGGQFSCKDEGSWLYDYCKSLGSNSCSHTQESNTVKTKDVFNMFVNYAENYDSNVLKTGIKTLDSKMRLLVGTSNNLLAPPGLGKSSIATQILNHNSLANIPSIFYSLDMYHAALYLRMLQRHTALSQEELYRIFREDKQQAEEIANLVNENYKNVNFCFKSGINSQEIEETILETENKTGQKIKLVVVDYNELVTTSHSDSTASSSEVAQRMRQIANDRQVCVLSLLQPSKMFTSPADEFTTYSAAKGSSSVAQAATLILGCSRPGFDPRDSSNDNFINITCLKNRNGPLFSLDFRWDGLTGRVDELEDGDLDLLREVRAKRDYEKERKDKEWSS
jgi:hypothetical protein